jgi:hypothetical protein
VQLFRLPKKQETKKKWLEFIQNENKQNIENGESLLCINHFSSDSWKLNKDRSRLSEGVIPTIGCDVEEVIFSP